MHANTSKAVTRTNQGIIGLARSFHGAGTRHPFRLNSARTWVLLSHLSLVLVFGIGLLGCAAHSTLGERYEAGTAGPSQADRVRLYLYRPQDLGGSWWPRVYVDGVPIADLLVETFTYVDVRPGVYHLRGVQTDAMSGKASTDPRYMYEADIKVSGDNDVYVSFFFDQTGLKGRVSVVSGLPIPYSEKEGQFLWIERSRAEAENEGIRKCRLAVPEKTEL